MAGDPKIGNPVMKLSGDYDLKSWSSGTKVTNRKYSEEQVGIESLTIKKGR